MSVRTTALAAIAASPLLLAASAAFASPDRLQGAWVSDAAQCDQVFVARQGRLTFKKQKGDVWSGFIVSGKHVRGVRSTCDLISSKQKGDVLSFLLSCKDAITFDTMSVSVRFKDDNTLVRFDPDFPEVETRYNRCNR
uniref:hypothetical protein n=1 Tax=unclassified Bosea (in: a-proteobacteria) TaxID=2653178 RepID=UPI000F760088|nr:MULTISPECIES: hypothetical protein [unclassified Bosea (in: a-proteobacteria)]AZO76453.1 hypothetical protein BLM15_01680 [Bosea sp. Tri-49]RXT26380.1 hypothetical protein B5U98_07595 [Bosea sp. Tri-39]RXT31620.1 hypothetical protein B5U99_23140 [Bosea sp. Tri-54]